MKIKNIELFLSFLIKLSAYYCSVLPAFITNKIVVISSVMFLYFIKFISTNQLKITSYSYRQIFG